MGNRGSAMGLKGFLLIGSLLLLDLTNAQDCCQKKVVTAPSEHAGTFTFVRKFDGEKDSNCFDACIYSKDGADGEEFCFKAVDKDAATINEECDATPGPTTDAPTGTTSAAATLDPKAEIKKANEEIAENNKEIEGETEKDTAASSASSVVDGISSALDTGRKLVKRQSDSASTIAPLASITQCPEFETKFKELLSNLKELDGDNADDKIPMIKELVRILNEALPNINTLCDKVSKKKMKEDTATDVQTAKEKTTKYREKKKQKIKELVVKVQIAQHKIEESNQVLVNNGFTKIPALQLPSAAVQFTVENPLQFFSTTPIGSSPGSGGSTPGGSSPASGGSTPGGSTPGGSSPGGSSPGGSSPASGGSTPGGSSLASGGSTPGGSTAGGSSPGGSSPGTSPRPTTRGPGRLKHFKDFKKFQH